MAIFNRCLLCCCSRTSLGAQRLRRLKAWR